MSWQFPKIIQRLFADGGASSKLRGDIIPFGSSGDTACVGNDTRLSTPATTSVVGHVKLNNTVTSTSTTEAATPYAVKQAFDKAASMTVPFNSSVSSNSTNEAATPYAVKQAYDRASNAASAASSAQSTANYAQSTANSAYNLASNAGGAPTPSSYSGKGQWVNVNFPTAYVTLPSGGTWAYHLANVNSASGAYYFSVSGVASGGSQINTLGAGHGVGLVWRVA